ncbi:MAG TPA: hypothetical protein VFW33_18045, partial [Gemmataceae bacterium]|nr:hypothetical protein [Gemmataceae bacterium]
MKSIAAKATGSTAVAVRCEKCWHKYYYKLTRTAVGRCDAPYGLGEAKCKKQARRTARRMLRRMLEHDVDPVPCPQCGWVQAEMVRVLRELRHRKLRLWGLLSVVAAGIAGTFTLVFGVGYLSPAPGRDINSYLIGLYTFGVPTAVGLTVGPGLQLVRLFLNSRFTPNDADSERERIELGRRYCITKE